VVFNGILKLMPTCARTVNCQLSTINRKFKGFTLIELLVVITLFAITSTLITASYVTFERNQRIRNAAQTLKNDLRFAQNKALAGDKGVNSECPGISTLIGWYVEFDTTLLTSSYSYTGACRATDGSETYFNTKTVNYPSGVTLNNMKVSTTQQSGIKKILFRPLFTNISLHNYVAVPPQFLNSSGELINTVVLNGDITIELKESQTGNVKTVTVRPTGEISGGQ